MNWKLDYAWKYLGQIETYKRDELIAFGNYILTRRKQGFLSKQNQYYITQEDIENFKLDSNL